MSTKSKSHYMTGWEAYWAGASRVGCLFREGSPERIRWMRGYAAAEAKARKDSEKAAREAIEKRDLPDWVTAEGHK